VNVNTKKDKIDILSVVCHREQFSMVQLS